MNGARRTPRLAVVRVADASGAAASASASEPGLVGDQLPAPARPHAADETRGEERADGSAGRCEADTLPTVPRGRPARSEAATRPGSPAAPAPRHGATPAAPAPGPRRREDGGAHRHRAGTPSAPLPAVARTAGTASTTASPVEAATVAAAPVSAPGGTDPLLELLPEGPAVVYDAEGLVVTASREFARLAGTPVAEMAGRPVDAVLVTGGAPGPTGETGEIRRRGGATVPVRLLRWDRLPNSPHRALLAVDVSDLDGSETVRRTVDAAVADERRRLERLTRLAGVGAWELDRTADVWTISSVARTLFGLPSVGPVLRTTVAECVHPMDRPQVWARWTAMVETGARLDLEVRAAHAPNRLLHVRAERTTVGARVVITGSVEDVTERRAVESRMRTSTQRFTDLLAVAPVGVAIFDDHERLVQANQSLCRLLGEGQEALRGRRADELLDLEAELGPDTVAMPAPLLGRPAGSAGSISWSCTARALRRRERGARGELTDPVWCELHVSVSVDDAGHATHLVVFTDVTENRRVEASLRHQAMHDELTGLPNRRALTRAVSQLLSGPSARRTAVLFCDLDNFKRVNDSLGHDAGDELLVWLADRLRDGLPPGCSATRHSGDEFVVVCADVDAHGGLDALTDLVGKLLRTAVPVHGQLVRVSATIGAAVGAALGLPASAGGGEIDPYADPVAQVLAAAVAGGDVDEPELPDHPATGDLIRFADAALFEAKSGSSRVALADEAIMRGADEALRLESQLRQAMVNDELVLHFQPVVGPDGCVQTAEALVRWQHPEHGLIFPDKFLPIAEAADLLGDLDRWVLRAAVREAATWPAHGGRTASVAVNLAGLLPGDPDFLATVHEAVAESGLPWDRLVLELVETCLADLPPSTLREMNELIAAGVRFAVDDFGTGYSSLSRLTGLPAQIVKLDRGFVRGVATGESDRAVARAVVELAAAIGQTCVAEGVEDADQFAVLRDLGVDAYQGWLFARAMPGPKLAEVLARGPIAPDVADAS
ncbi:EAL domain-containing protein [Actinomycetospora sp. OC33-EN08]|uniref:EAL domain-containing protein n=1 Tax=Actinomycetospora aurantiaca TaxID=3129233 RepID=A0ABU8MNC0_9PSEU